MLDYISNSPANTLANVMLKEASNKLWIITGPSGCGKTNFCLDVITQAQEEGGTIGGFICPAVFEHGKKIGIDILDVASGEKRSLGKRSQTGEETTVGCWYFDEATLDWGNQILKGLKDEEVIVIDELGPLELKDGRGYQEALRLLDEKRYRIALVVIRPSLLPLARLRWPEAQVLDMAGEEL